MPDSVTQWQCAIWSEASFTGCPFATEDVRELYAHLKDAHGIAAEKVRRAESGYRWHLTAPDHAHTSVTYLIDGRPAFGVVIWEWTE